MKTRQAFESWWLGPRETPQEEHSAWEAWQAATLSERERAAKVCESKMPNPVCNWADAQIVEALQLSAAAIRAG